MKRTGIPLHILHQRLGASVSRGVGPAGDARYRHQLVWECILPPETRGACLAYTTGDYKPIPSGLTPFEQEFFEHAPLPKDGWTVLPCPKHTDTFNDYEPEAD